MSYARFWIMLYARFWIMVCPLLDHVMPAFGSCYARFWIMLCTFEVIYLSIPGTFNDVVASLHTTQGLACLADFNRVRSRFLFWNKLPSASIPRSVSKQVDLYLEAIGFIRLTEGISRLYIFPQVSLFQEGICYFMQQLNGKTTEKFFWCLCLTRLNPLFVWPDMIIFFVWPDYISNYIHSLFDPIRLYPFFVWPDWIRPSILLSNNNRSIVHLSWTSLQKHTFSIWTFTV